MLLLVTVQSVPSPIGTRPISRASGRVRASILRLLAGQWAIGMPWRGQSANSASLR